MNKEDAILFSGGIKGAEAEFGANAERLGIEEVNFTFEGHGIVRRRGLRVLNHEELKNGDVSLEYVSSCLLYTSDAADDLLCVDLGGRRIIKKTKTQVHTARPEPHPVATLDHIHT